MSMTKILWFFITQIMAAEINIAHFEHGGFIAAVGGFADPFDERQSQAENRGAD
jgi:hypothetical protein